MKTKSEAYQGDDRTWGVMEGGGVVYEPMFARMTAEAIADMENSENPPANWEETKERLLKMGLPC